MSISAPQPEIEIRRHAQWPGGWTYALLDRRQREIAERVRAGGAGAILLSELAPVITRGRRAPDSDLLSPELLARAGVDLYDTDRGGLATYHGPGQWVLFVVDRLEALVGDPKGVRLAVDRLLTIGRDAGVELGVAEAKIREGAELGVWSPRGKFSAVGVHISQGVLLHGLSVNAYKTTQSFYGLRPCGLDAPVDFLLENRGGSAENGESEAAFEELGQALIRLTFQHFYR